MQVIVSGPAGIDRRDLVDEALKKAGYPVTKIISGCGEGVEQRAKEWAKEEVGVEFKERPAKWEEKGPSAAVQRNWNITEIAEALVAIWDGKDRDTKNLIEIAYQKGLRLFVVVAKGPNDVRFRRAPDSEERDPIR